MADMSVILAVEKNKAEDPEFEDAQGHMARPYLKGFCPLITPIISGLGGRARRTNMSSRSPGSIVNLGLAWAMGHEILFGKRKEAGPERWPRGGDHLLVGLRLDFQKLQHRVAHTACTSSSRGPQALWPLQAGAYTRCTKINGAKQHTHKIKVNKTKGGRVVEWRHVR